MNKKELVLAVVSADNKKIVNGLTITEDKDGVLHARTNVNKFSSSSIVEFIQSLESQGWLESKFRKLAHLLHDDDGINFFDLWDAWKKEGKEDASFIKAGKFSIYNLLPKGEMQKVIGSAETFEEIKNALIDAGFEVAWGSFGRYPEGTKYE